MRFSHAACSLLNLISFTVSIFTRERVAITTYGKSRNKGQQTRSSQHHLLSSVQEASYEPVPPVLPTSLDREEVLLLTVNLSSNGEIALHSSRSSKTSAENGKQKRSMVKIMWDMRGVQEENQINLATTTTKL